MFAGIPQHDTVLGDVSAPVTMVEYVDLQCPDCQQFETLGDAGHHLELRAEGETEGRGPTDRLHRYGLATRPRGDSSQPASRTSSSTSCS